MSARPRHAMVVHAYYPLAETRVQREAEALVAAGYDVTVICLRAPGERARERYRGVDVERVPVALSKRDVGRQLLNYLHFFTRAGARLTRLHARVPFASVQVHNLPDFLVFCAAIPRLRGVPVVLDLHDLMPEFFAAKMGRDLDDPLTRLVRWQERAACRFATHVITVSDPWRQTLIDRGVAPEACSVVMNVADDRIFTRATAARTPSDVFRLLYHGAITHRYGLDLVMRAVAALRPEIPELRLTVVGDGDALPDLRSLRRELGLTDVVEFLRPRPATELPELLASADVGLAAYRDDVFTDSLVPTKLMEYAAMGMPCIASRTTAIERYFTDTMVEFFRPGDVDDLARCIRLLWVDPGRRAELAAGSERFTSRYAWPEISRAYVDLIASLSGVRSSRARGRAEVGSPA